MTSSAPTFADEARGPWSRWQAIVFDVALTGVLLVVAAAGSALVGLRDGLTISLLQIVPLVLRRVRPAWCIGLLAVLSMVQLAQLSTPVWGQIGVPFAIYSAAAYGGRATSGASLLLGLAGALLGPLDWAFGDLRTKALAVAACGLAVVLSWVVGALARTRTAYVEQLIDRGIRLERESAQQAELAASDERARIAREMHDVVAHGLSVMVVQADGARYQLDQDPERVAGALDTISDTGRESLAEMRRMLGLLRTDDGSGTRPQPGLDDLAFLVDQDHGPGMSVESHLDTGLAAQAGAGVGLTAYRVVQESLTNVRRHAGPDVRVVVRVTATREALEIDVRDDGRGAAAVTGGIPGHGLLGMRERIAVHGGTLRAGPVPGGYAVHALIPYSGGDR